MFFFIGSQKAETKGVVQLQKGVGLFNETLTIESNVYLDEDKNVFLEKKVVHSFNTFSPLRCLCSRFLTNP